jgi:hypothetical protein
MIVWNFEIHVFLSSSSNFQKLMQFLISHRITASVSIIWKFSVFVAFNTTKPWTKPVSCHQNLHGGNRRATYIHISIEPFFAFIAPKLAGSYRGAQNEM